MLITHRRLDSFIHFIPLSQSKEADYVIPKMTQKDMDEVLEDISTSKKTKSDYYVATKKPDEVNKKLNVVLACGGIVTDEEEQVLLIYRNGKWDLPKGKKEKGETKKQNASREVEEETGVKDLKVGPKIGSTYHWYHRNKWTLKQSTWYRMKTYNQDTVPQAEEGIKKAIWADRKKVKKCMKNMYPNIKMLLEEHYL